MQKNFQFISKPAVFNLFRISNFGFRILLLTISLFYYSICSGQNLAIARVKYEGGGDWYNDPDAIPNLAQELNKRTNIKTDIQERIVSLTDEKLFQSPFLFITGHGNIKWSDAEVSRLREYLASGGFLYADDDYGMDESFRREIEKVFPNQELVELPADHQIYNIIYNFPKGLPKIHEHYEGAPKGFAIFYDRRMVVYYTWNSNISDGWTTAHDNPYEKREQAFQMGINIVAFALTQAGQ